MSVDTLHCGGIIRKTPFNATINLPIGHLILRLIEKKAVFYPGTLMNNEIYTIEAPLIEIFKKLKFPLMW